MTTANKKLCRDIAEAEKWEFYPDPYHGSHWFAPNSTWHDDPPAYLTDPAEALRMEEELIGYYKEIAFRKTKDSKIIIMVGDITQGTFEWTKHSDHKHAIAEAHLARLKETK